MKNEPVLNRHGMIATHEDCISGGGENCKGDMIWSENINTGKSRLRCAYHTKMAHEIQVRIHAEYLNDTVTDEGA